MKGQSKENNAEIYQFNDSLTNIKNVEKLWDSVFAKVTGLGNSHCYSSLDQLDCVACIKLAHKSVTVVFNSPAAS